MNSASESLQRTFRIYAVIAGVLLVAFWIIFRMSDPTIIDPLWIRIVLSAVTFGLLVLSYTSEWVEQRFIALMKGMLYVYTVWIVGLNVANSFSPNYVVALLFVIAAIGVAIGTGLRRTVPILYYLGFATLSTSLAVVFTRETASASVGRLIVIACVASVALVIYVATRATVRAHEQLSHTNEALVQRNRELHQFTSAASHDLQEPLRKIQMFSDLLRTEYAERFEDQPSLYLGRIQAISAHMSRVVQALLDFSRVAEDTARFDDVDLDVTVDQVMSELEHDLSEANAYVEKDELPRIKAEASQMYVLFLELFRNAVAFRRPDCPLTIWLSSSRVESATSARHRIVVRDNGIGFDQRYAARIFSPFERLNPDSDMGGVGMGLTICRRIVSLHGGSMSVESQTGTGTTFIIELPSA